MNRIVVNRKKFIIAITVCAILAVSSVLEWQISRVTEAAILAPYNFYDNFSGDLSKWTVVSGTWAIEAEQLSGETSAFGQRIMIKDLALNNFTAEYEVEFVTATHYEIGLVFRGVSGDESANSYWVGIKSQGLFFHERKTGSSYTLGSYSFSPSLNTIYIVKVEAKGQIFKVWLNGILRIETSNPDFTSGTIGIMAWSSASEHAHLDYVCIRDASPPPGLPSAYSLSVRAGVTEVIVTCAWTGSGNIMVRLVSPTITYDESSMQVYEKTTVSSNETTASSFNIKRAALSISPPSSSETWTLYLDLSGVATFQVSVETI